MSHSVNDIIAQYRHLTVEKAALAAKQAEEMKPLTDALTAIETYLLARMQQEGVQNYKTEHGTAYQSRLKSMKSEDPIAFRNFILYPVASQIQKLVASGVVFKDSTMNGGTDHALEIFGQYGQWDLVDFRPGKKGILAYQDTTGQQVPGVSFSEIVNVNIRGS